MDNTKEKKKKTGRLLRIFPCLIVLLGALLMISASILNFIYETPNEVRIIISSIAAVLVVLTILLFVCYHYSKYKKWCNNIILALGIFFIIVAIGCICGAIFAGWQAISESSNGTEGNSSFENYLIIFIACGVSGLITLLIGICGVVGAKRGKARISEALESVATKETNEVSALQNNATISMNNENEHGENANYDIKVEGKIANKKTLRTYTIIAWISFSIVALYYVAWIVLGIFSIVKPENGILWDIETVENITDNYLSGFICLLFVPAFLYYVALFGPFYVPGIVRKIIFASGIVISVVGLILYFTLLDEYFLICSDANTMKLAPVLSSVGLLLVYALGLVRINPAKIQHVPYKRSRGVIVVHRIINRVGNVIRAILRWRNNISFIIIGTFLFTLLVFVFIEVLYFILPWVIITFIVCVFMYIDPNTPKESVLIKGPDGDIYDLTFSGYNSTYSAYGYYDQYGNYWLTKNGSSFVWEGDLR